MADPNKYKEPRGPYETPPGPWRRQVGTKDRVRRAGKRTARQALKQDLNRRRDPEDLEKVPKPFWDKDDDAFMIWANSSKPCQYCGKNFIGPVCPCEEKP